MARGRTTKAAEKDTDISTPIKSGRIARSSRLRISDTPTFDNPMELAPLTPKAGASPIKESQTTIMKENTITFRDPNLTIDSCVQKLTIVENEKAVLQNYVDNISIESKLRLEASLEDLKQSLDFKLTELSSTLQSLFVPEQSAQRRGKKIGDGKNLYRKSFVPEESLLSKMLHYDDENYKTIFNIMLCVLILWGASLAFHDYTTEGLPNFDLLHWGIFRDLPDFCKYWLLLLVSCVVCAVYLAHFAASASSTVSYVLAILLYTTCQISAFAASTWVVSCRPSGRFSMPLAIGFMAEQTRMSMKMHSYFREKITWRKYDGKLSARPESDGWVPIFGWQWPAAKYLFSEVEKYVFFMFVPTLVYRDAYPRTAHIRWSFLIKRFGEVCGLVYFSFLVFRQALPQFEAVALEPLTLNFFVTASFNCMGPAMASMVFTHFLVLHVVQNIGAEVTRFADRKFYEDWWNSRNFSVFYRKWNGVVHDWIHSYLYTDLVEFCGVGKLSALLCAFFISAIIHEYLICIAMGFFFPILGILFTGPGLIFIVLTKDKTGRVWNIFMWLMLAAGNSWLMVLYCKEFYLRSLGPNINPSTHQPWTELGLEDFFVPRLLRIQYPGQFQ